MLIEVYVNADNKVVSNSPLVVPVDEMKAYTFDYAERVVKPRRKLEKEAKAFAEKAKRHNDSVHDLFHIINVIDNLTPDQQEFKPPLTLKGPAPLPLRIFDCLAFACSNKF